MIAALIGFLGSLFSRFLSDGLTRFVALKIIMVTLLVTFLPVILNNFVYSLFDIFLTFLNSHIDISSFSASAISITSISAWIADKLQIVSALSVVLSAVIIRWVLNLIPFVG